MVEILDSLGGEDLQQIVNELGEKAGVSTDKVGIVSDSLKQVLGQGENTGAELLNKLTGDGQSSTLQVIGEKTGVSLDNVSQIFQNLTPMISNFFRGEGGNIGNMFTSFLDKNKDGNVMDDITGGIGNLFGGK